MTALFKLLNVPAILAPALDFKEIAIDIDIMIQPENKLKQGWDVIVLAAAISAAIVTPLSIIFHLTSFTLLNFFNGLFTMLFLVDIAVSFNTTFSLHGKIINDRKIITRKYLCGWFWPDVIAALPVGLLFFISGLLTAGGPLQLLRLNLLFKLPKASRTLRMAGGAGINPAILRLVLLVFWIFLAAHFISCSWILVSGNPDGLDPVSRYIRSFYWTITTLTTVGYGDITPSGNTQTLFVVLIQLLGAGMYGLIIGNIANLLAHIDVAKSQYKEKLEKINTFLKYRNIPLSMQKKINNYYSYLWESRRGYDESSVLQDLPDHLKVSVSLYLNKEIIEKVPIFEGANEDFIKEIILNLTSMVFTPGDSIVKAGEVGFNMYFISKGSVDVMSADEKIHYATLGSGNFFGEIALLLSMPRTATIKAREYCDLYRLDKETFDRVLSRYPEFAETITEMAEKRRGEIETAGKGKDQ